MSEAEKVNKKSQDLTHEEYIQAADYWKQKDAQAVKMDRETLEKEVEAYIQENNTCALATGAGEFVRCTPVEYSYHDGAFWIFSEGGEKFAALEKNKNVCLAIFDKYQGFGNLKGMQVTGKAVMPKYFSEEYVRAADIRKIPVAVLKKLPHPMNLIKIISEIATKEDLQVGRDLMDTLRANKERCVGMAANMIGVKKNIIIVNMGFIDVVMFNPVIVSKSDPFETEEGCLSLDGVRKTVRYQNIEVEYYDFAWKKQRQKLSGWTAQIVQHEVDHLSGILI